MSRLNRIGNELALVVLVGVVLSIVMVVNQQVTESSTADAGRRANVKQRVADGATKAEIEMRNMQLSIRIVRFAKVAAEIERGNQGFQKSKAAQDQSIDAVSSLGSRTDQDRFAAIKALTAEYRAAANYLGSAQFRILEFYGTRDAVSTNWASKLEKVLASPALAAETNRGQIESWLRDADGALNALLAAGRSSSRLVTTT